MRSIRSHSFARSRAISMNRVIFFVCLSALQLASSTDVPTVYAANSKKTMDIQVKFPRHFNWDELSCYVVSNTNKSSSFERRYLGGCIYELGLNHTNHGIWNISATGSVKGEEDQQHAFRVVNLKIKDEIREIPIMPSKDIIVSNGDFVKVFMPGEDKNFTSCTLIDPSGQEHILTSMKTPDFELYKQCGVRMRVDNTHSGDWELYAHSGNNTSRLAKFKVSVKNASSKEPTQDVIVHAKRNQAHRVDFNQSSTSYCSISDPRGQKVIECEGPCFYDIPVVTSHHDGWWVARYFVSTENQEFQSRIFLQTHDVESVNATVDFANNNSINLLCKFKHLIEVCLFKGPDKQLVPVHAAIGNDEYEYYGQGFGRYHDKDNQDCGITIKNPKESDYGTWKCISDPLEEDHSGSILHVLKPTAHSMKIIATITADDKVYVIRGDSFQIKCNTNMVLEYCWIRSPNGTSYQMTRNEKIPKDSLPYHGAGFSLGECGATIRVSNYSDNGEWSCHMGVQNGPELEARIAVKVAETPLMAKEDEVNLNSGQKTLSCIPVPGSKIDIDYCRWIKPDGSGIHYESDGRYSLETNSRYCKLIIADNGHDNNGRWTCIAGITYDSSIEHQAYIDVYSSTHNSVYLISIIICAAIIMLSIIGAFVYKKWLRRVVIKKIAKKPIDVKHLIMSEKFDL